MPAPAPPALEGPPAPMPPAAMLMLLEFEPSCADSRLGRTGLLPRSPGPGVAAIAATAGAAWTSRGALTAAGLGLPAPTALALALL